MDGAGLEQDDLFVFVNGPLDILRVLVMTLQFQGHGGYSPDLIRRQAGDVPQGVGDVFHDAFHAAFVLMENHTLDLVGNGLLHDVVVGAGNLPLIRRGSAVHHHLAESPESLHKDVVGAQIHGMA